MDLIDDPQPGANEPEFSVTELSTAIKRVIEGEFSHVRIRGEVGRVSRPRSGHVYLDLKDDRSVLAGVIWKGVATRLSVQPEEGMEVVATGRLTTFGGQSRYQIVIEDIRPAGVGALMAMLEKRKAQLASEGLFAPERKKPLPYLPEVIGVITSPSGAVIRDILHRLRDRFPRKVLIWPVAVQGDKCAAEVANAIRGFNDLEAGGRIPRPDLIIVARGGGSIEDLWGFNEETVARAAAASDLPLISAVGHETDTTLIDYVSDRRAPTPTAAAEMAVPVRLDLLAWFDGQGGRMRHALLQAVARRGQRLADLSRALPRIETLLDGPRQSLDRLGQRLPAALLTGVRSRQVRLSEISGSIRPPVLRRRLAEDNRRLEQVRARLTPDRIHRDVGTKKDRLEHVAERFRNIVRQDSQRRMAKLDELNRLRETLGYRATLKRGYAVVHSDGAVVKSVAEAELATRLEIEFADGRFEIAAPAGGPSSSASQPRPRKTTKAKPKPDGGQGSLF